MKFVLTLAGALLLSGTMAFASPITYVAILSGPNENPPNGSTATGTATAIVDATANTMQVLVSFSGITSDTTAAHIHCCISPPGATGVATTTPTFAGFPLGVTDGMYNNTLDLLATGSYNPSFISANGGTTASAEAALLAGISEGQAYLNIHSNQFPGGEIRGFLVTPEPSTLALVGFGLTGLVLFSRKRLS
jgi:hypothetical protein